MHQPTTPPDDGLALPAGVVVVSAATEDVSTDAAIRTPIRRNGGVELVLTSQPTRSDTAMVLTVPDALGIGGDTQICLGRANRIMQDGQTTDAGRHPRGACGFCGEIVPEGVAVVARDNPRPFGSLVHKVVFSRRHLEAVADVTLEEFVAATEVFHRIASEQRVHFGSRLEGLTIGMNFGEYIKSGASQAHFHYQVTGLGRANYNPADRLGALCRAYARRHLGADYMSDYEQALYNAGLVVVDNDLAFAYTPVSPRFTGETQIMLRRRGAGHILDTTEGERRSLASLQQTVLVGLERLGCTALNQVWYATRFDAPNDIGQRLVISICPRPSIVAFFELAGHSVTDTPPWTAAERLRNEIRKLPDVA